MSPVFIFLFFLSFIDFDLVSCPLSLFDEFKVPGWEKQNEIIN